MATIHFLNVNEGDCAVIKHNSGHVTVIDVCNAKTPEPMTEVVLAALAKAESGITGNFSAEEVPREPNLLHARSRYQQHLPLHPDPP